MFSKKCHGTSQNAVCTLPRAARERLCQARIQVAHKQASAIQQYLWIARNHQAKKAGGGSSMDNMFVEVIVQNGKTAAIELEEVDYWDI
jgi:hypothetical protein